MKTDWMIGEPIDFEYHEYKMLAYFQKVSKDLDEFKLYPHFRDVALNYASFSNLKSKDRYIKLVNELEEVDEEILLTDLDFVDIPKMSLEEYSEYRTITSYGEEKFKDYFMMAKTIWSIIYESIWVSLLENDNNLSRGVGYVFFDYEKLNYLYRYELRPLNRNPNEKRIFLVPIEISQQSINIPNLISEDIVEVNNPEHPIFIIKIKNKVELEIPFNETILPMIKRKINSFINQSKKYEEPTEK